MKLLSRVFLIALIPILIFFTVFILTYYTLFNDSLIDSQIFEASSLLQLISRQLANPVYFLDVESIDQILDEVEDNEKILSSFVFSLDGKIISDFETNVFSNKEFLEQALASSVMIYEVNSQQITMSNPIMVGKQIGVIIVEYSLDSVNQILSRTLLLVIGISFVSSGTVGLLSFVYNRKITNFLFKISKYSEDIATDTIPKDIPLSNIVELDELYKSLEIMRGNLESYKHELIISERLSSIGELSARLSHDLRNPLGVIKNTVDIISMTQMDALSPKMTQYIEIIKNQTDRLNHQINNVLDFVRSKDLIPTTVSFQEFLNDTLESIQMPNNIIVTKPENDIKIIVDVEQIRIVFVNIITNAIQAIKDNTAKINIRIFEKEDTIHIEIEDSGPGIDPRNINRIFDPLFTTKQEGTGLGLASCNTIIKKHGGKIHVQKAVLGGASFTIVLPKKLPL